MRFTLRCNRLGIQSTSLLMLPLPRPVVTSCSEHTLTYLCTLTLRALTTFERKAFLLTFFRNSAFHINLTSVWG